MCVADIQNKSHSRDAVNKSLLLIRVTAEKVVEVWHIFETCSYTNLLCYLTKTDACLLMVFPCCSTVESAHRREVSWMKDHSVGKESGLFDTYGELFDGLFPDRHVD